MAMFGFGKKKNETPSAAPGALPTDQVLMMMQQGYTDDQIVQNLQGQGYNSSQIFDAMNHVNISGQMPQSNQDQMQQPFEQQSQPQMPEPNQIPTPENVPEQASSERIEELAEAIIDEKWKELVSDINKIIEWKDKTEARMTKLEQQLLDFKSSIDSLHKSLINKVSQYDKNILDVGTEIKAMEKVFQKVLPSLTENVNRLERIGKKPPSK